MPDSAARRERSDNMASLDSTPTKDPIGGTVPEHFCTYFDHRYLARGVTMWESLKRHCPAAELHVLCLTPACEEILSGLGLPDVHLIPLDALECAFPELTPARVDRNTVEYYFTLTPYLPLYLLDRVEATRRITYVDADLFFFGDPQPIFDEVAEASIGIIEHRFPERLQALERRGRFNVGWLTFRDDAAARACLDRWRGQCLEWCHDREEPGRFADQKYLDDWPERVPSLRIIEHKGANVAPWNLDRFELVEREGKLFVGTDALIFFHAHGFEPATPGAGRFLNVEPYGVTETPLLLEQIFDPYTRALDEVTKGLASAPARVPPSEPEGLRSLRVHGRLRAQGWRRVWDWRWTRGVREAARLGLRKWREGRA